MRQKGPRPASYLVETLGRGFSRGHGCSSQSTPPAMTASSLLPPPPPPLNMAVPSFCHPSP